MEDRYYEYLEGLEKEYISQVTTLEAFCSKLHQLLSELLNGNNIRTHLVESRVKTVESFMSKVMRDGKHYSNPIDDITDQCGLRIILFYPSDVDIASKLIDDELHVLPEYSIDKRTLLETDQFGYLSVHKVITLRENRSKLKEWSSFNSLKAEIQIRTVLQHSWAAISHELQYKHEKEIPSTFRRKLVRLSGLLELADEEFQDLKDQRKELVTQLTDDIAASNLSIELNLDSLLQYFATSEFVEKIIPQMEKIGYDHDQQLSAFSSDPKSSQTLLVSNLLGLKTLEELDGLLKKGSNNALKFFKEFHAVHTKGDPEHIISGGTDHWIALLLAAIVSHTIQKESFMEILPWHDGYLDSIMKVGRLNFKDTV